MNLATSGGSAIELILGGGELPYVKLNTVDLNIGIALMNRQ